MNILAALAQVTPNPANATPMNLTPETVPTEAQLNIIDLALKGGWVMGVLLILSLVAIYFFIYRRYRDILRDKQRGSLLYRIVPYDCSFSVGAEFFSQSQPSFPL